MEKLKEHKHQIAYAVLAVVILLLLSGGKHGRYAIACSSDAIFVLDTKTSEVWRRYEEGTACWGTNEKPSSGFIPINPKDIIKAKERAREYQKRKAGAIKK